MPLGRKPRAIPRRSRHIYLREDIAATVDLILLDPMREKVKYGKWSDLVEALLRTWISEQRRGGQDKFESGFHAGWDTCHERFAAILKRYPIQCAHIPMRLPLHPSQPDQLLEPEEKGEKA